ncbi:redox-sensing transcriptional repressor Rex [candidate division KSB1 bacterium]|nr:redox-sensing transcriptional repressor Rex [candidate division KSB1 bacterium]
MSPRKKIAKTAKAARSAKPVKSAKATRSVRSARRRDVQQEPKISDATVKRLSKYYRTLHHSILHDKPTISSEEIATHNGVTSAQVRKDLSMFGAFGRRGLGYSVHDLHYNISHILGLNRQWNICLVGAGNIGTALIHFRQFAEQGFVFRVIFDSDPKKRGTKIDDIPVFDLDRADELVAKENIKIAVLALPALAAQKAVDRLVQVGVRGFLNFAPVTIHVPKGVHVRNENMAIEIEALSYALSAKTGRKRRSGEE